jgi:16S rRNA (adenine1518-N6/adenine1519-N6)-dimethyltransferase
MSNPPHIRAKKRWSQNFFQDAELLHLTLAPLELSDQDHVLEIGPGPGVLTEILLDQVAHVTAVEIDPYLYRLLSEKYADHPRLTLIHQDVMRFDFENLFPGVPLEHRKLIANIPYHLTSPIVMKALNEKVFKQGITADTPFFSDICLMVQKEVAERLAAAPGIKAFGALTVSAQYAAEVDILAQLPRHLFKPAPKVDSALVRFQPRTEPPITPVRLDFFWRLVRQIYQMRRKTLRNALRAMGFDNTFLEAQDYNFGIRGETLNLTALSELSDLLSPHFYAHVQTEEKPSGRKRTDRGPSAEAPDTESDR